MMTLHATLYRGARDPVPISEDTFDSWPDYVNALHDVIATDAPEKTALLAIGPHRLRTPYRVAANVVAVTILAIDVDGADLVRLDARVRLAGIACLVYGSPSDTPDTPLARRVRVLAPVSREITPEECAHTRLAFAEALGLSPGCGVESCLDVARLYFVGRVAGTPAREWRTYDGATVDVDALMRTDVATTWRTPVPVPAGTAPAPATPRVNVARDAAMGAILVTLGDARDHDGRKWAICGALGGITRRCGWTREDCAELVRAWLPAGDAAVDVDAGVTWACGAWTRPATEVTGAGALRESLGREAADVVIATCTALARPAGAGDRACALEGTPAVERDVAPSPLGGRVLTFATAPAAIQYLVPDLGIAHVGKCAGVHGYAGAGKSPFLDLLTLCLASGKPFLGHTVARTPAILVDFETGLLLDHRLWRLAGALEIDLATLVREEWLHVECAHAPLPDLMPALESLARTRDKGAGTALLVDSYSSGVGGDEIKSEYADPLWELGRLGQRVHCVPIVNLHDRKTQSEGKHMGNLLEGVSGTNRLVAALATSLRLTPTEDDPNVVQVACTRSPSARFECFAITWADDDRGGLSASTEAVHVPTAAERDASRDRDKEDKAREAVERRASCIETILARVPGWMSTSSLRREGGINGERWADAIEACLQRGTVQEAYDGHTRMYALATRESVAGYSRTVGGVQRGVGQAIRRGTP